MTDMRDETERGDLEPTLHDMDDSDAQLRAALEKTGSKPSSFAGIRARPTGPWRGGSTWAAKRTGGRSARTAGSSTSPASSCWNAWGPSGTWIPSCWLPSCPSASGSSLEWGITTAAEAMLVDLAVLNYYHALRVQDWIGDLRCTSSMSSSGRTPSPRPGSGPVGARAASPSQRMCGDWPSSSCPSSTGRTECSSAT